MKDIKFKVKMLPEDKVGAWETSEFKLSTGGNWIIHQCSECKVYSMERSNYCPNCGAKMEGE